MRLPWQKDADPPADDDAGTGLYDDPPAEDDPPADDPLVDFDEDQRAAVEAYMEQARQEVRDQMRAPLQQAGLDVVDGKLVGDPKQIAQWMQPAAAPAAAPAAGEPPAEEPWPDAYSEPEEFRARMRQEIQKEAQALLKQQADQQVGITQAMQAAMMDDAVARLPQALKERAPYLAGYLQHPEFAEAFRAGLAQGDPRQWRDSNYLAMIAGAIAPQLGPPPAQPRQPDGRFAPVREPQRPTSRVQLGQIGASPSGSTGPTPQQYTDIERLTAERLGISLEKARATADPTGEALRAVNAREKARARR